MGPSIALLRMNEWTSSQAYSSDILKSLQKVYWALRGSQAQRGPTQQISGCHCPHQPSHPAGRCHPSLRRANLICSSTSTWAEAVFSFRYDKLRWKCPVVGLQVGGSSSHRKSCGCWEPGCWCSPLPAVAQFPCKAGRKPARSQARASFTSWGLTYQLHLLKGLFIGGRQIENHCQSFPHLMSSHNNHRGPQLHLVI